MILGTDQLQISPLKPPGSPIPTPDMALIDRARHYGLESLPAIKTRDAGTGAYEILSGLLTWRVAQALRIDDISVQCVELGDDAAREIVRDDFAQNRALDPITQAEMLHEQIHIDGISRRELGERYSFSRSQISHLLRLLQLDETVREWVRAGALSAGKARALVGLPFNVQHDIADKAKESPLRSGARPLNTRQVEKAAFEAREGRWTPVVKTATPVEKDQNTLSLENELSEKIGNPVTITWNAQASSGSLNIAYFSLDELQHILQRLESRD